MGALTAIGALSIDMFLPGLPELKNDFNTTTANAQLTLSLFMIGLGLGNLFVGPISDSIGRKKPLVISMIIFALASLGIVFVENIWIMVFLDSCKASLEVLEQLYQERLLVICIVEMN